MKAVRDVLLVSAVLAFAVGGGLHMYFGLSMPRVFQEDAGRTHPVRFRSVFVYLTDAEYAALLSAFALFFVAAVAGFVAHAIADRQRDS